MTLTLGNAPLATDLELDRNFDVVGPRHRLLFTPFPRRVRATLAGVTVLDTRRGMLLHESNLLPVLYLPLDDVRADLLVDSDHHTHCPFKGDASYHSLRVGDRLVENAIWSYPTPLPEASWLEGYVACYWDRVDQWFDEDEPVAGHLRDPYHRVDVRRSSRHVRVSIDGRPVAESRRPMVLSETGLPNRWYLPAADVTLGDLVPNPATSVCPYKGVASYWDHRPDQADAAPTERVAFGYPEPLDDAARVAGMLCFVPSVAVTVEVDGDELPA